MSTTLGRAAAVLLIAGLAYVYQRLGWPWLVLIILGVGALWVVWFLVTRRREIYAEYTKDRDADR